MKETLWVPRWGSPEDWLALLLVCYQLHPQTQGLVPEWFQGTNMHQDQMDPVRLVVSEPALPGWPNTVASKAFVAGKEAVFTWWGTASLQEG